MRGARQGRVCRLTDYQTTPADYTYSRKTSKAPSAARPGRSAAQRRTSSEEDHAPLPHPSDSRLDATPTAYSQRSLPPLLPPAPSAASTTPADYLPRPDPYPYPYRFAPDAAAHASSLEEWVPQKFSMAPPPPSVRQPLAAVRPLAPPVAHPNYPPSRPQPDQYPSVTAQMTPHYQNGAIPAYQQAPPANANYPYDQRAFVAHRPIPMQPAPEQLWRHGVEEEVHAALPWSSLY